MTDEWQQFVDTPPTDTSTPRALTRYVVRSRTNSVLFLMLMTSYTLMFLTGGVAFMLGITGRLPLALNVLALPSLMLGVVAGPSLMLRAPRETMRTREWVVGVFGTEATAAALERLGLPVWPRRIPPIAYGIGILGILVLLFREAFY
jgi:hypothetical protein